MAGIRRCGAAVCSQKRWTRACCAGDSLFATDRRLFEAASELEAGLNTLDELGFTGDGDDFPPDDALSQAQMAALAVINAGERLLLFHKRLALSGAAYGFLHSHDLLDHWNRYGRSDVIERFTDWLRIPANY